MRRSFSIPVKAFSVNAMYYGQRAIKTQACRNWEYSVIFQLSKPGPQAALKALREAYEAGDTFKVRLVFYYPEQEFRNKQGLLSSKAFDLTNVEKPILDLLFLPKVHQQELPRGCPNINQDDKYVTCLHSYKKASEDQKHRIDVTIWLQKRK